MGETDLISRQAAIDFIDAGHLCNPNEPRWSDNEVVNFLKSRPSAQPERKKGKWIDYTDDGYVECPFCHSATNCDGNKDELHYCFSCGADMRGEQDDESRSNSNAQTDTRARGMGATDKSSGI